MDNVIITKMILKSSHTWFWQTRVDNSFADYEVMTKKIMSTFNVIVHLELIVRKQIQYCAPNN